MSLVVVSSSGPNSIQDLGRSGHMHEGVPPGGAAVRTRLIAANREAANRDDAAAIEIVGSLVVRAEKRIEVATPEGARILERGEELKVSSRGWTYLAVRGGIAAPLVLGGRGALPGADRIRGGDRLDCAGEPAVRFGRPPVLDGRPARILPGPDLDAFAPDSLAMLCSAPYKVVASRVGAKLFGTVIARRASYRERSRPMVRGAIEVPPDGDPFVLGPDHPTTGGYAVLAVVVTDDLDRVFGTDVVRFTTSPAE